MEHLEFFNNNKDLSTDRGFQFEFFCDCSDSGHRTTFKPSLEGKLICALDTASYIFGGTLGKAADIGDHMYTATRERPHAALAEEAKNLGTEYWREGITATCTNCEKPLAANAKFCPECGFSLKPKETCPSCGAKTLPEPKFCAESGQNLWIQR